MSGHDANDATSLSLPVPDFSAALGKGLEGKVIGVPRSFLADNMDAGVRKNFDDMAKLATEIGAEVRDIELPHTGYAIETYYILANAEASANLARFDGVKYGYRARNDDDLYSMYTRTRDEGFGPEVKRRILLGTYVLSAGYYDAYYHQAQKVRSLIISDFKAAFGKCDLIMLPTAPTTAFRLGEKIDDPITMYLSDIFTIPVNLAGLPAISIPSGLSEERLPFGLQFIAPALGEAAMFCAAAGMETAIGFEESPIG
jgi:aspartyl-tRNA(Asn)/glutamyl-tRNA(Gln) amidotransferase subunit A